MFAGIDQGSQANIYGSLAPEVTNASCTVEMPLRVASLRMASSASGIPARGTA